MTGTTPRVVVAGLGSEYRRDDGAGPLIAARAVDEAGVGSVIGPLVDPLDLLGEWDEADLAVVVDAVRSGVAPGTLTLVELTGTHDGVVPAGPHSATSTHGIGLAGVLRLARAIDRAPARVVVVGIEGEDFGRGTGLSPSVEAAVPAAVSRVVAVIKEGRACV
jgi:hydrogenase maturation protease